MNCKLATSPTTASREKLLSKALKPQLLAMWPMLEACAFTGLFPAVNEAVQVCSTVDKSQMCIFTLFNPDLMIKKWEHNRTQKKPQNWLVCALKIQSPSIQHFSLSQFFHLAKSSWNSNQAASVFYLSK